MSRLSRDKALAPLGSVGPDGGEEDNSGARCIGEGTPSREGEGRWDWEEAVGHMIRVVCVLYVACGKQLGT